MFLCVSNLGRAHTKYWVIAYIWDLYCTTSLLVSKYFPYWLTSKIYFFNFDWGLIHSLLSYKVQQSFTNITTSHIKTFNMNNIIHWYNSGNCKIIHGFVMHRSVLLSVNLYVIGVLEDEICSTGNLEVKQ